MENRQLFLRVLQDLEQRLQSEDVYEILGIARLVRQLLVDGTALADQVVHDQLVRLEPGSPGMPPVQKLSFQVTEYTAPQPREGLLWWSVLDALVPIDPQWNHLYGRRKGLHAHAWARSDAFGVEAQQFEDLIRLGAADRTRTRQLKRDALFRLPVVLYEMEVFTVHDLITHIANSGGAVHFGRPRDSRGKALHFIANQFSFEGIPLGTYMLRPIGMVVRRALEERKRWVLQAARFDHARIDISIESMEPPA